MLVLYSGMLGKERVPAQSVRISLSGVLTSNTWPKVRSVRAASPLSAKPRTFGSVVIITACRVRRHMRLRHW